MKSLKRIVLIGVALFAAFLLVAYLTDPTKTASEWHEEPWMQQGRTAGFAQTERVLAMTDLPPLNELPSPEDYVAAVELSKSVGANGAVLTFSWPSLEYSADKYSFDELRRVVGLNEGRQLYLGIQVLNTTVKELPSDLAGYPLDDERTLTRFRSLLDAFGPFLKSRVKYLSIGNEVDIYLSINKNELKPFHQFLDAARSHAKKISPDLIVGTTLTDQGAQSEVFTDLVRDTDAHFLTYYHGQTGVEGKFRPPADTEKSLLDLAATLDDRPIIFQEIGFPSHKNFGPQEGQAIFVSGLFDAWEKLGGRVPFLNYFMLYDFPAVLVDEQINYYGVDRKGADPLSWFITSLGLHSTDGKEKPAWQAFQKRSRELLGRP